VDTPPTDAGTRRGLRDRPLGKVAILVAVLLVALVVARTCGSTRPDVSSEEAEQIAREQIDFSAPNMQIRNVPRGFERRAWIVDLYTGTPSNPGRCRQVEIDAESGEVIRVRVC
jgi:Peptidase propeptide and YPEB domain